MLPAEAEIDDRAGRMGPCRFGQAGAENCAVAGLVADCAQGEPEGMLDQAGERGLDELGDLSYLGDGDGGEAVLVEDALEQSHGLLADRSGGDEQDEIDGVREQLACDLRAGLVQ